MAEATLCSLFLFLFPLLCYNRITPPGHRLTGSADRTRPAFPPQARAFLWIEWTGALALEARNHSYAPYSHFGVGAALLTESGKVYQGCNVENASYGGTICAERNAALRAVYEGERRFTAIAVAGFPDNCLEEDRGIRLSLRYLPSGPAGICRPGHEGLHRPHRGGCGGDHFGRAAPHVLWARGPSHPGRPLRAARPWPTRPGGNLRRAVSFDFSIWVYYTERRKRSRQRLSAARPRQ